MKLYFNPLPFVVRREMKEKKVSPRCRGKKRQRQSEERQSLITLSLEVDFLEGF